MATNFLTPAQCAQQYLLTLKTLKPEVDIARKDSDWWVRAQTVGGVFSGIYADQQLVQGDIFPQSARHEALGKHLETYLNRTFNAATPAAGNFLVTGATGSVVPSGTQFAYLPNGNTYATTVTVPFTPGATSASVPVQSVATGSAQNLLDGAVVTVVSPPTGINPTATAIGNISDGTDDESDELAAQRILTQIQTPLAGGKVSDYQQFAEAADPAVTSASIIRYPFGLGTVGVVITSGTTDVDTALNNGLPVVTAPTDALIAKVQAFVDTQDPITDCATVLAAATASQDVSVTVRFASGNASTLLTDPVNTVNPGATLTQAQFVAREVKRAIFKTPVGGRMLGSKGYVVLSEIEDLIDENLGAEAYATGAIVQIVLDRQVSALSASGANRLVLGNEQIVPGTITIVDITGT